MSQPPTVFLLSPAYCGGRRAAILLKPGSIVALAQRLQAGTLTLGEAFSFMSGLYFRGKLTYATAFARPARAGDIGVGIITPTRGLQPPDTLVSVERIREFASVDVSEHDARYRVPLERDTEALARQLPETARVVLLGSVATGKCVEILASGLGPRLHYPPAFIGRGDMSRGGLLPAERGGRPGLEYAALDPTASRRGARPPKLDPLPRGGRQKAKLRTQNLKLN